MIKKNITYFFKLLYLMISWFVIAYTCDGEINTNLFCISIFTYAGGVVFDSLFYLFESLDTNTILRNPIILSSTLSFVGNFFVAILSLIAGQFITIPYNKDLSNYIIVFNNADGNGIINLYPSLSEWYVELPEIMLYIMFIGIFSLFPAFLLEVDSYISIRNDKKQGVKR